MSNTKPDSSQVKFIPAGAGAVSTTAQDKLRESVSVLDFGADPTGVTDSSAAFTAFLANKGNQKLEKGGIYTLTAGFDLEDTILDLNGSTLNFTTTGDTHPIRLLSNSGIKNGRITSSGSAWGAAGQFGSPISIGEYIGGSLQQNIFVDSVSLYSVERACVYIIGDVSNVTVNNVVVEDSATQIGIPIVAHWGRDLADPAFTELYHPRNITISNIEIGKVPLAEHGVGVSSAYNCNINNVRIVETGGSALWCFVGDYGFWQDSNPDALESLHGMSGITVDNFVCYKSLVGVSATDYTPAISPYPAATWPVSVVVSNSVFFGPNDAAQTTAYGVIASGQITVENCKFYNFYQAVFAYRPVSNIFFRKCELKDMFGGVFVTSTDFGAAAYKNINFEFNVIANCNRGSVASLRLFTLRYVSGFTLVANQIDMTGATSVVLTVAANVSDNVVITNNIISGCTSGNVAIVIANGASAGVGRVISNNTIDAASLGSLYGGELYPTGSITPWGNKIGYSAQAPTIGTWKRGDIFFNYLPAASGPSGWMCVTAGAPGTWKAMANLAP